MGDFFDMKNTFTDDTVDMLELVKRYRADNSYVFYASLYEGIITIECAEFLRFPAIVAKQYRLHPSR